MFPGSSSNYVAYYCMMNVIFFTQLSKSGIASTIAISDFYDFLARELRCSVSFAFCSALWVHARAASITTGCALWVCMLAVSFSPCKSFRMGAAAVPIASSLSTLLYHIGHIVGICPKPKVSRINARRVVSIGAIVAYKQAIGNRAMMKLKRKTMRPCFFSEETKATIPTWPPVSFPNPALFWATFLHLFPKSLFSEFLIIHLVSQIKTPPTLARRHCLGDTESQRGLLQVYDYMAKKTNDRPVTVSPKHRYYSTFELKSNVRNA